MIERLRPRGGLYFESLLVIVLLVSSAALARATTCESLPTIASEF
jgi:hypothetical protein